jgi:hypothetical protein
MGGGIGGAGAGGLFNDRMSYTDRILAKEVREEVIRQGFNQVGPYQLEQVTAEEDMFQGIDFRYLDKSVKLERTVQLKERRPGSGNDLGVEAIKPWGLNSERWLSGALGLEHLDGRDVVHAVDRILWVDGDHLHWRLLSSAVVMERVREMVAQFLQQARGDRAGAVRLVCGCGELGEVRVVRDPSAQCNYRYGAVDKVMVYVKLGCLRVIARGEFAQVLEF